MNEKVVIAVINRKTSCLVGFLQSGLSNTTLNPALAVDLSLLDPLEEAKRRNAFDRVFLYQVWRIESY